MKTSAPTSAIITGFVTVCHQAGLAAGAFHKFLAPLTAPGISQAISLSGKLAIAVCYIHFGWHFLIWILKVARWSVDRLLQTILAIEKIWDRGVLKLLAMSARTGRRIGVELLRQAAKLRRWLAKSNPCSRLCTKALASTCTTPNCPLRI